MILCLFIFLVLNLLCICSLKLEFDKKLDNLELYNRRKYLDICREIQSLRNESTKLQNQLNEKDSPKWH